MTGFLDSCAFTSTPEVIQAGNKDGLSRWIMGQRDGPVLVKSQPRNLGGTVRELEMVGRAPTSPPDVAASRAAVTNPKKKVTLVLVRGFCLIHNSLSTYFQLSDGFVLVCFFL